MKYVLTLLAATALADTHTEKTRPVHTPHEKQGPVIAAMLKKGAGHFNQPTITPTAGGSSDALNTLDLTSSAKLAAAAASGINVASPLTVTLTENPSTGFTLQSQATPSGCVTLTQVSTLKGSHQGSQSTATYEIVKDPSATSCTLSLAFARTWNFAGFGADGSCPNSSACWVFPVTL